MLVRSFRLWSGLSATLLLSACSDYQPYQRPGDWRPLGANASNLTAMVANPNDLLLGHGAAYSDGEQAADAVARWRAGAVRALPNSAITDVKSNDAGNSQPATATPAAASAAPSASADAGAAQ